MPNGGRDARPCGAGGDPVAGPRARSTLWQPLGMPDPRPAPRAAAALAALLLVPLTGCTDQEAAAEDSAARLAAALADGDVAEVVGEEAQRSYRATVAGMGDVEPTVSVEEVDREDDTATAVLRWSWPLEPEAWEYDAEVAARPGGRDLDAAVGTRRGRARPAGR